MRASRLAVVAAATAVLLTFGWWLWPSQELAPSLAPAAGGAPTAAASVATGGERGEPSRHAVVQPEGSVAAAPLVVRGRCLAAEGDQPLAAVLRIGRDDGGALTEVGALATAAFATVATTADGRFEATVPLERASDLRVHAEAVGRAPAGAKELALAPGSTWDLGDVRLVRAASVRGVVVDTTGTPVPDVEVGLLMLGEEPPALPFRDSHTAVSDARGAFAFAQPVAAGEWYVRVERTGALRAPRKLQLVGGDARDVRIEVERPDPALALHGVVVDATGAPLAGVELSAYGEGARGRAVSGADGTFVLSKGPPHFDQGEVGIELLASHAGYEQTSPSKAAVASWGRRDVVVAMRALPDLVVRAVDARGAVVWPFTLLVGKVNERGDSWYVRSVASQRAGPDHVVLPRLPSGLYSLVLLPQDRALAAAGPVAFRVDEHSPRELRLPVAAPAPVAIEVVDAGGAPVPDCTVELLRSLSAKPVDAAAPAPDLLAVRAVATPGPKQAAVAQARTDASGRATLSVEPGEWWVRTRCPTHQPAAQPIVVAPRGGIHRLVLAGAALVRGRLHPLELLPALGLGERKAERRLAVVASLGKDQVAHAEVAADGTFVLGPLPPALVTLQLRTWLFANPVSYQAMPHALGAVDGSAVGAQERSFDVAAFAPATVTGVVQWDGQPLRHGQFFLRRLQPEPLRHVRVPTDGEGRFRTLVPPGTLGPQLAIPSDPGPGHVTLPLDERHLVAAGGTLELRLAAAPRTVRLRLLQPDGAPLANTRVVVQAPGHQRPGSLATDGSGELAVALAPYGEFVVVVKAAAGEWSARVPAAGVEPFELRLQAN